MRKTRWQLLLEAITQSPDQYTIEVVGDYDIPIETLSWEELENRCKNSEGPVMVAAHSGDHYYEVFLTEKSGSRYRILVKVNTLTEMAQTILRANGYGEISACDRQDEHKQYYIGHFDAIAPDERGAQKIVLILDMQSGTYEVYEHVFDSTEYSVMRRGPKGKAKAK